MGRKIGRSGRWGHALIRVAKPPAKRLISVATGRRRGAPNLEFDDVTDVPGAGITTTDGNKVALAIMTVLLLTMGLGVFSNALYAPDVAAKPGYALPSGGGRRPPRPRGRSRRRCRCCSPRPTRRRARRTPRSASPATASRRAASRRSGPPLYDVVGRPKGSIPGFGYSDGMKAKGGDLDLRGPQHVHHQAVGLCLRHQDDLSGRSRTSRSAPTSRPICKRIPTLIRRSRLRGRAGCASEGGCARGAGEEVSLCARRRWF